MDTKQAVATIQQLLDEIPSLRQKAEFCPEHIRWMANTGSHLTAIFGPKSPFAVSFLSIEFRAPSRFLIYRHEDIKETIAKRHQEGYLRGLDVAEGLLSAAIDQLQTYGLAEVRRQQGVQIAAFNRKIFIAHGRPAGALDKLERFVRSLGFEPVIVKYEPSLGKGVDDLVEQKLGECICAIILATADDRVEGQEYFQPRLNVIHEIGLAQEKLQDKVIYLKEANCQFPSNVSPKVWESFTQDNMEKAFEKIVKELRGFGFIA